MNILSDWNTSDTATSLDSGTSMATPHVSGVAARYLQNHPAATPAQVWAAIHTSDDVTGTPAWGGIGALPAGSPNELLHWGSLNDGYNDGDPHLVTVDGAHFNFQGGGEYVYLRDNGLEIQTRETPVQTASSFLGADPYDGIASCVSLNTAVAAHVGAHRVTFEPGSGDAGSMVLRIDGTVVTLTSAGINLGGGAHVAPAPGGSGIEIDFADGTTLVVISSWWPSQNLPYLNVDVFHTAASAGLMGAVMPGSWLPALPNGASVGAMPAAVHDRYAVLYRKFGDAWRVTNASSLFDYQPGQSTGTFSYPTWPAESPPCKIPGRTIAPAKPIDRQVAVEICRPIEDKQANADCVFDVALTGEKGFADAYLVTQKLRSGATRTVVSDRLGGIAGRRVVLFTALVRRIDGAAREAPAGTVQFMAGRERLGAPVKLDAYGRARFESGDLKLLDQDVAAHYLPAEGSALLSSSGVDEGKAMSIK